MKKKLRRVLSVLLSVAMVLSTQTVAFADNESSGQQAVEAGTYTVPVSNSDPVAAMNTEFGGVVGSTATANVKSDGPVELTLGLQTIVVMTSFDAWVDDFYGYYAEGYEDGKTPTATNISSTTQEITVNDGSTHTMLNSVTFTAANIQDSYRRLLIRHRRLVIRF